MMSLWCVYKKVIFNNNAHLFSLHITPYYTFCKRFKNRCLLLKYGKMFPKRKVKKMNILNIYNEFDINNFDLSVDHYGSEKCDRGYSFGPTIRDNYVIHFILEGKGKLYHKSNTP